MSPRQIAVDLLRRGRRSELKVINIAVISAAVKAADLPKSVDAIVCRYVVLLSDKPELWGDG